jgi:hypothetical protein
MWRDLANQLGLTPTAPASAPDLAAAEATVGCALPRSLRQLLQESDGLHGEYGFEVVFSASEIARQNHEMRTTEGFAELYMPFDCLLFIGAEGNGDLYAFPILAGGADDLHVFVWDHETDSRTAIASGLAGYVKGERWAWR